MPALAAGVPSIGETTFKTVFHRDLDPEPTELAVGRLLHVTPGLLIHVPRMGIERRHHAVDRTLDELGIIGLFDIVGPDSLEHVAEQGQLRIGVGAGGGLGSRDPGLAPWSVHEKGEARTGYRAEEKDGILAHWFANLLAVSCWPPAG